MRLTTAVVCFAPIATGMLYRHERSDVPKAANAPQQTSIILIALTCRWRSRPKHQKWELTLEPLFLIIGINWITTLHCTGVHCRSAPMVSGPV